MWIDLAMHAGRHVTLAACALALALAAGVPLGIAAATVGPFAIRRWRLPGSAAPFLAWPF